MDYPFRISEHIFLLGNHYFATYLITGERGSILIDPGVSFTANQVIDQIKTLGLAPSDIEKLFITHAHADHVGGAPVLKKAMPDLVVTSSVETDQLLKKDWIYQRTMEHEQSSDPEGRPFLNELYHRYFVGEATMFSEESSRYCVSLLTRRILEAKG